MFLEEIDLEKFDDRTSESRWAAGTKRDRRIYKHEGLWYKVWGSEYITLSPCAVGNQFKLVSGSRGGVHGFEVGLYTPEISGAFVDFIYDQSGSVRGYVTRDGDHPDSIPDDFARKVFSACVSSGWVYSDLSKYNVIAVGGGLSLIDFDTHLSDLSNLDIDFEKGKGALRAHVPVLFRQLLENFVRNEGVSSLK